MMVNVPLRSFDESQNGGRNHARSLACQRGLHFDYFGRVLSSDIVDRVNSQDSTQEMEQAARCSLSFLYDAE